MEIQDPLIMMPYLISIENEASDYWLNHLIIVALVGEFEGLGLFLVYRRIYSKVKD